MPPKKTEAPAIKINTDDELAVIGAAMADQATRRRVVPMLRPDDFCKAEHQAIWGALTQMERQNLAFSEDTLASLAGSPEAWGGFEYVRGLITDYGKPLANSDFHVKRVRLSRLKLGIAGESVQKLLRWCEDPKGEPDVAERWALELFGQVAAISGSRGYNAREVAEATWKAIESNLSGQTDFVGFEEDVVDQLLSVGFERGRMSIIGAKAGSGKSSLVIRWLARRALNGKGTCYISCESIHTTVGMVMCSSQLKIPLDNLLTRKAKDNLSPDDQARVKKFLRNFWNAGPDLFEILDNPFAEDVEQSRSKDEKKRWRSAGDMNAANMDELEGILARTKHRMVILDLVAYALPEQDVALLDRAIMRMAKMAKRYAVHLVLIHHLKRATDSSKKERPPKIGDLRATGGWENFMDNVFLLDRPKERLGRRSRVADTLDLYGAKQRDGRRFAMRWDFKGEHRDLENPRLIGAGEDGEGQEDGEESTGYGDSVDVGRV